MPDQFVSQVLTTISGGYHAQLGRLAHNLGELSKAYTGDRAVSDSTWTKQIYAGMSSFREFYLGIPNYARNSSDKMYFFQKYFTYPLFLDGDIFYRYGMPMRITKPWLKTLYRRAAGAMAAHAAQYGAEHCFHHYKVEASNNGMGVCYFCGTDHWADFEFIYPDRHAKRHYRVSLNAENVVQNKVWDGTGYPETFALVIMVR